MSNFSFLIELAAQKFDEIGDSASSWIMAMPLGNYKHPQYGNISLTPERISQFADNVNNNVRGQQLDIDYDHKEYGGEAAGWVKQAEARPDGLWLLVDWTQKAYEAIKSKAYRYFSPEFSDAWNHPGTGEKFKDVLFGGGITNRPFLKGIQPLNLSEFYADTNIALKENGNMNPEQVRELAKALGMDENISPEALFGALLVKLGGGKAEEPKRDPEPPKPDAPKPPDGPPKPPQQNDEPMAYSEDAAKLAENSVIKKLTEQLKLQTKKFADMEVESQISKLSETAAKNGRLLDEPTLVGLRKLLSESPSTEYSDLVIKMFSDAGGPLAGEIGGQSKRIVANETDSVKEFSDKVKELMKSNEGMSFSDAAIQVAAQNEDTFTSYRNDSYFNGKEGA